MEQKHAPQYVRKVDGRTVVGIFSVFGNRDSYNDVIQPGAFAKTIQERAGRIVHLWQHDMQAPPIARVVGLRELTRAELPPELLRDFPEASGGAEVTREYLDTPRANEVLQNIKAGVPLQMSFAFDAVKYDFEELPDAKYEWEQQRNLREVRLWETSDVLWGANEATLASKADAAALLHELRGTLRRLLSAQKAGARHSNRDTELINSIAAAAVELGATNAKLMDADETDSDAKSRAARGALTQGTSQPGHAESRAAYLEWQKRRDALRTLGVN
jgi:HK97 family phage prohead protease